MSSFASGFQLGPAPGILPLKTRMGEKKERGLSDEEGFLRHFGEAVGTGRMEEAMGKEGVHQRSSCTSPRASSLCLHPEGLETHGTLLLGSGVTW